MVENFGDLWVPGHLRPAAVSVARSAPAVCCGIQRRAGSERWELGTHSSPLMCNTKALDQMGRSFAETGRFRSFGKKKSFSLLCKKHQKSAKLTNQTLTFIPDLAAELPEKNSSD